MATVRKIFDLAAAILFTSKGGDTDYDTYSPLLLERLLIEALPYENAIRAADGREELASAPEINAIDDTVIDWDDRITRGALPHGPRLGADDRRGGQAGSDGARAQLFCRSA